MSKARVVKLPQRNVLAVPVNAAISGYLDELVTTGLYGASREDAARRLLEMKLEELIGYVGICTPSAWPRRGGASAAAGPSSARSTRRS